MQRASLRSTVLSIGGVDLRIRSDGEPLGSYEAPYLPFLDSAAGHQIGSSTIDITVVDTPASANGSPAVFDSGGAWMMQAEDEGYRLSFRREGSHVFHTVACSDASTSQVRVYVHQDGWVSESSPTKVPGPVSYPLDQLLLMNHLAPLGGVIVHGAGAVIEGRALVFPGRSGAGKSTLARLLANAGLGDSLLSDDRVVLRTGPGPTGDVKDVSLVEGSRREQVTAWGTPWPGDARVARNAAAPLSAMLFLVKADTIQVRRLAPSTAVRRLMPVVSCPWYDADRLRGVLDSCARIVERTPCYDLFFRPETAVVAALVGRSWTGEGEEA